MREKELRLLVDKYLQGNCTPEERKLMDKVLDSYDTDQGPYVDIKDETAIQAEIFTNIRNKAQEQSGFKKKSRALQPNWSKIAVAVCGLVVALGTMFWLMESPQTAPLEPQTMAMETSWGQRSDFMLSDGSHVYLNSGSSLEFPKTFEGKAQREVVLKGEAFFEVAKNPQQPFVIRTENLATQVVGTSFNINAYTFNQSISVTVKTGKVQVSALGDGGNREQVLLLPNQKVEYGRSSGKMVTSMVDNENYLDWKNGIIRFNDIALSDAAQILSRWYGVHIDFANQKLPNCHITARYEKAKLQVVLESIKYAMNGMDYQFMDDRNILFKGFCTGTP